MKKKLFIILMIISLGFIPKITLAETYDGEYSIDYLLRNYNLVTLGIKDNNYPEKIPLRNSNIFESSVAAPKGSVRYITNIDGAVLINGNVTSNFSGTFGSLAGNQKSYVKGSIPTDYLTISPQNVTDPNYIDFSKMYENVMRQSQLLAKQTEYYINSSNIEISNPGIYTIDNTAPTVGYYDFHSDNNSLLINNYDRNSLYVFNYNNEYFSSFPSVNIVENGSPSSISLKEYIESGNYTGNIIFNFPKAKYILIYDYYVALAGNIIAPNAFVELANSGVNYLNDSEYGRYKYFNNYYGSIIANSIGMKVYSNYISPYYIWFLKKANYTLSQKIVEDNISYYKEAVDYSDDLYTRDYSISDLLKNYSLVTLGHKQLDSKSKLLQFGNTPGSVRLFHITGPALINGDLYSKVYDGVRDDYYNDYSKFDRVSFDMECNEACESYIKGNVTQVTTSISNSNSFGTFANSVIQPWDNMSYDNKRYFDKKNMLFVGSNVSSYSGYYGPGNLSTDNINNYINFDRLYNNIVAEQKEIDEGIKVNPSNRVAHIEIGGNYVINNINDIDKIVFDNFSDNEKMITVITIKNSGDINFPELNRDTGDYKGIVTNDYFGKENATHLYEENTFLNEDSYYGNIVWNVPNATYIKLKENVPFAGHLIAPNADVETPETHFAGCFIVNSIYGEGNTEAHFYPLTAYDNCECDDSKVPDNLKMRFNEMRLNKLLGGEKTTIETNVIGDEVQYNRDTELLNSIINTCPRKISSSSIPQILTNPKTYSTLGIVLVIALIGFAGFRIIRKNRKTVN